MSEEGEVEYSHRLRNQEQGMDPEHDNSEQTLDGLSSPAATASLAARYDILGELGHGGMGIVYKARDRETGEVVALKVLKPEIATHPEVIERFKAELRLARKITHKSVCRSYELLRFEGTIVITMEYVEGESLRAFLSRYGSVPLRKGLEWAAQICGALAEAHAQGVVHRDLKPENILIDNQGIAKVMDFGIARSIATEASLQGALGMVMGTPAYMSPEQAEGKPADARSDIYSLGLIFYEMFAGKRAFQADTPADYIHKQVHDTPPLPREVEPLLSGFLDRAIQRCLEKKPERRFQSITELETALCEEGEPRLAASGEEVELPANLTRWQRSDWLLVAAAVIGLALFFPFFNRTSLAPHSQVHFDHSVLRRIAEEYAQRLGTRVTGVSEIYMWGNSGEYDYVAKTAGARAALELTSNPVPYWIWNVKWSENGLVVDVDNRGALQRFWRDFPAGVSAEALSVEDARPMAEKALRDYFESDASRLQPEVAATDISSRPPTTLFKWVDPKDYHGLKRHYEVRLAGRTIQSLNSYYGFPPEYDPYDFSYYYHQFLPFLVIALLILIIGLIQRRQVDLTARWRIIGVGAMVAVGEWNNWRPELLDDSPYNIVGSLVGVLTAVTYIGIFWSVAIECSVRRVAPAKLSSSIQLFDGRNAASQACGLGILRGSLIGLALLGLDSFLVWGGTSHLSICLDGFRQILEQRRFLYRSWPTVGVVLWGFWQGALIGLTIVFLSSLVARFAPRRFWLAVLIPAALTAATLPGIVIDMGAVQPYHWKVALLFPECLLLAWCYARLDVLTTFWAVFTFAFFWQNYFLLVMFEPAGNAEQWIAFAVFGLFILAAVAVAFKTPLRAGYRRAAIAFQ